MKIGNVGAGDEKDQADNAEENEKGLAHWVGEDFTKGNELDRVAGGDHVLLVDVVHDAEDVGLGLGDRYARPEAADDIEVVRLAIGAELALPVGEGVEDFRNDVDRIDQS